MAGLSTRRALPPRSNLRPNKTFLNSSFSRLNAGTFLSPGARAGDAVLSPCFTQRLPRYGGQLPLSSPPVAVVCRPVF